MADKLISDKKLTFIALSCVSIGSLFGAFSGSLERFEVYRQYEINQFNHQYSETFIVSENQPTLPYGLDKNRADRIAAIYQDNKFQKITLLAVAMVSSAIALTIGDETVATAEIDHEVAQIETSSKKQLLMEKVKHRYAMMSLGQRELFKTELQELLELSGGDTTLDATELNATDKFINAQYLVTEGHAVDFAICQAWGLQPGTPEFNHVKEQFTKWTQS
jgi:ribosomal protein L21